MLDDNHGIAGIHQFLQHLDEPVNVCNVEAVVGSSRIYTVLPVERRASSLASLTRWASPPDRWWRSGPASHSPDPHPAGSGASGNLGLIGEKDTGLLHRHVQHIGNGLFLVLDLQGLPVVAAPLQTSQGT